MPQVETDWMILPKAAAYSGLSIKALRYAIYDKTLPAYKPRKVCLVNRVELDAYLQRSKMYA